MNQLNQFQRILLDTFKAFDVFCRVNGIHYCCASGTLIGAIRHKGFIPWDDDIDVFLLREDYDKLLSIKKKLSGSGYMVADYHDKPFPYSFAKFYSTTMTYWEYEQFDFVMGPYIDLFPLDIASKNDIEVSVIEDVFHSAFWKYRKSIARFNWKDIWSDIISLNGLEGPIKMYKKMRYAPFKERYYNDICQIESKIKVLKGDFYKPFWDVKHIYYPKEWFSKFVEIPFEDMTTFAPIGYHEYLTYIFGDYMTPPPPEKQVSHHGVCYMNLDKYMTVEEIMKERRKDIKTKKPMSLKVIWNELLHKKGFN